jgi:hypothetical protein
MARRHRAIRYKSSWREARHCGLFATIPCRAAQHVNPAKFESFIHA